jgi:hypothetical protein
MIVNEFGMSPTEKGDWCIHRYMRPVFISCHGISRVRLLRTCISQRAHELLLLADEWGPAVCFRTERDGDADEGSAVCVVSSKTTYSDDYGSRLIVLVLVIAQIFPEIRLSLC